MEFLSSRINRLINNMTKSTNAPKLHWAVRSKNKNEILQVLSNVRKENLKVPDQYGDTVLHLVFANENLAKTEIIELLEVFLDEGVDIYAENKQGKTMLHRSIQCRMKSVVDFLISRKVDINRCDTEGNSIAHSFVEDEYKWFYETLEKRKSRFQRMDSVVVKGESVKFLVKAYECNREAQENESARFAEFFIERGFNFDLQNDQGTSALHLVIERNLHHILHVLVKHTRYINYVNHRKKSLLQMFFEKKATCRHTRSNRRKDWYPEYASRFAAKIVRISLDRGVSIWPHDSDKNCTLIQTAIECEENTNIIKMLIDHGLKSMEKYSATEMFAELLRIHLWWGESKTEYFWPELHNLIVRGADVNAKDKSGMTPLYRAFIEKNLSAIHFLIERQADLSATTSPDENLFHALAREEIPNDSTNNRLELENLFHYVARRGCCNMNARNSTNETPLHLAAQCENLAIARKLIESGAEVNCKDKNGFTPLHHAMYYSNGKKLAERLLKSGADINSKDKNGRRPLSIAVDVADVLVMLLLKRGAYVNAHNEAERPFWKSILINKFHVAREMLAYGADINNNDSVVRSLFESPCRSTSSWQASTSFLLRHWIKLSTARMSCSKEYEAHAKRDECQKAYEDCLKEIEKLKVSFIDGCTSIYSFLGMDYGRRRSHMNNDKLHQLVRFAELEKKFRYYSVVIRASYHESVLWKSLLEPAKRAWLQITGIRLPGKCLDSIFTHLRNQDLVNMVEHDN